MQTVPADIMCFTACVACVLLAGTSMLIARSGRIRPGTEGLLKGIAAFNMFVALSMLLLGLRVEADLARMASRMPADLQMPADHLPPGLDNRHDILSDLAQIND